MQRILFLFSFVFESDHLYLCNLFGIWCPCLQDFNLLVDIRGVQPPCAIMCLSSFHVLFPWSAITINRQQCLKYFLQQLGNTSINREIITVNLSSIFCMFRNNKKLYHHSYDLLSSLRMAKNTRRD